jgi:hypothetical protein
MWEHREDMKEAHSRIGRNIEIILITLLRSSCSPIGSRSFYVAKNCHI